jgi:hypothetical protein
MDFVDDDDADFAREGAPLVENRRAKVSNQLFGE